MDEFDLQSTSHAWGSAETEPHAAVRFTAHHNRCVDRELLVDAKAAWKDRPVATVPSSHARES